LWFDEDGIGKHYFLPLKIGKYVHTFSADMSKFKIIEQELYLAINSGLEIPRANIN